MRGARASLTVVAALAACGCSFAMVRPPPPEPTPGAPLVCTQSRGLPALDTLGAVATPITGISIWALCAYSEAMQSWSSDPQHADCGAILWTTLGLTAAYTGSAVYGFHETTECRRLAAQAQPQPGSPEAPSPRPLPPHLAPTLPPGGSDPATR